MSGERTSQETAPIDVIVVAFPDGVPRPEGFAELLGLCEQGVIAILDVEFVVADDQGVHTVAAEDLPPVEGLDLSLWAAARSDLIDADDLAAIGDELGPGELAVLVLIEQRWVLGVVEVWRRSGARLLLEGGVPVSDLLAVLDETEKD
ncbi:MAG: DUF6325 family protein [Acidimicrobiales bacterium]|jgi:hypothetical protein|nr:DUF6325 family protein [Acidimicrobiales bacterium]